MATAALELALLCLRRLQALLLARRSGRAACR